MPGWAFEHRCPAAPSNVRQTEGRCRLALLPLHPTSQEPVLFALVTAHRVGLSMMRRKRIDAAPLHQIVGRAQTSTHATPKQRRYVQA
jgi:hypothetical protein